MLFRRRKKPDWKERLRIAIWPRRSWVRSFQYVSKRIMRLTASPHAVAAGVAAGVFASFTPFFGFHFFIAFIVAYVVAGNMAAAALGTFVGNPLTFPFITYATLKTGRFVLQLDPNSAENHEGILRTLMHSNLTDIWQPLIKPMIIGGLPLGILAGIIFYIATRWAAIAFRTSRAKLLADRATALKRAREKLTAN